MNEISTLLVCPHPLIDGSTLRPLHLVSHAMLTMTGRVTMLGISRWTEKGGSYRTIQRFFRKNIPWASLNWAIVQTFLVTKSGKETYGLGRFFSSIYLRSVPHTEAGLLCLRWSLRKQRRRSNDAAGRITSDF